jgi:uncharacterized protein (DUF1501 family)
MSSGNITASPSRPVLLSRRGFVTSGGAALLGLSLDRHERLHGGPPPPRRSERPVLVCVLLRGGVDGLSVLVPYGDPRYYATRPGIAIAPDRVIDLDGRFGLHPRLAPLKPLWDGGRLAIIPAVGAPLAITSHVDAQAWLESGGEAATRGWLNRYCGHHPPDRPTPLRAVAFGARLPRLLAGPAPAAALRAAASPAPVPYPAGALGGALHGIAGLIQADVGLEVAVAEMGGWDTHIAQGAGAGPLADRLDELARALAAFAHELGDAIRHVVVLTLSEFGRSIRENGARGTDHGRATTLLALGGPVNGGRVLGCWPGLHPAEGATGVAVTTDVRSVTAEVLARHLAAADPAAAFPACAAAAARFPGVIRV